MGKNSEIQWTDHTWNPWYGCIKVSQGCKNCYMYRNMARTPFNPHVVTRAKTATFNKPLRWDQPALVFTCSWSDFFIEAADRWRAEALQIIADTPHLTYQILTKRPERVLDWLDNACWPVSGCPIGLHVFKELPNVWLGVSVENQEQAELRIPEFLTIPARTRFLSCEPLLGEIDLTRVYYETYKEHFNVLNNELQPIHWVITGGESGPANKIRTAKPEWFRSIRDQCNGYYVPYFHKQNGGSNKVDGAWGGRELDDRTWDEMPHCYQARSVQV